ncbi:glycoside hydrolase family 3 C-terminal domain-containing protein [Azospirillum sp. B4]|uniref:glycoside hydrolase family 3 protein n=1 Tax=Azospirillum sp. B4 TaxID=95605 RepID=UPI00034BC6BA|nr:glycoside hydrolase family 3 C-terminal domain-containing protein [Azospirillum sp. B4]
MIAGTATAAVPRVPATDAPAPETESDPRAVDLVARMTLDEKIALIRGAQEPSATDQGEAGYLAGVPRLGIPPMRFADGPPGILTREPSAAPTATMGLAATFSREDAEQNGAIIGLEARRLGVDVALEPFINMLRDISFGRGWNTFGEDPLLTSALGAAQITGIQGQGVMAQAKHYLGYDLMGYKTTMDAQTLHEVYLPPFAAAVDAGVSSLMCAYNYVNGQYACSNADLMDTTLRGELGFKGFVTSDWGAVHAATDLKAGLDMEMPGLMPPGSPWLTITRSYFDNNPEPVEPLTMSLAVLGRVFERSMPEEKGAPPAAVSSAVRMRGQFPDVPAPTNMATALKTGTIAMADIDRAAIRVVHEMNRFGFLDGKTHQPTGQAPDPRLAAIIRKTSSDAAVLLKNEGGALPLKAEDYAGLALIGPGAGQVVALGINAEHSLGLTETQHSVVELMQRRYAGRPGIDIQYAVGDDMTGTPIPPALYSADGKPGLQRFKGELAVGRDAALDFTETGANAQPAGSFYTWRGELEVPAEGIYGLYLQVLGAHAELRIDGKVVGHTSGLIGARHGDTVQPGQDNLLSTTDGLNNVRRDVALTQGRHTVEVVTSDDTSRAPVQIRLNWVTPAQRAANLNHAVAIGAKAKKVVIFAWARQAPLFGLAGGQDAMIDAIASANPNTVVVLNTSYPVAMPWLSKVKAVVNMWWPGDQGGEATMDVLTGTISPAGRLPFTWARALTDYPATDPRYPERGRRPDGDVTYSEGLDIGYRWFVRNGIAPLYAFGHGLSYTTFAYSGLSVRHAPDGGLDVAFKVKNTGAVASDEVPQVYLSAPKGAKGVPIGVRFAAQALAGFDRIHLDAGETKPVIIHVPLRSLQYWDKAGRRWVAAGGTREVSVGPSSQVLPLSASSR